ncbi:hypothetical protein ACFV98_11685 [Streptomyces violascens]|uniref:hypothetical protein n=1 Tax=Streptomyces violascens TaxID=67381 RepID=UPI00365C7617
MKLTPEIRDKETSSMALALVLAAAHPHVVQSLVTATDNAPLAQCPANLLVSVGVMVCKLVAREVGSYFHLVVSDQATADCEQDIEQAFLEEGLPNWRESVIEIVHNPRPSFHFPGSTQSTLYVIHPKVSQ